MADFRNKEGDNTKNAMMRQVTEYLFGMHSKDEDTNKNPIDNDYLAMRTDIQGKEVFNACTYYAMMEKYLHSPVAGIIRRTLQLQLISLNREGRKEAVKTVETGQFPTVEKLLQGYERHSTTSPEEE